MNFLISFLNLLFIIFIINHLSRTITLSTLSFYRQYNISLCWLYTLQAYLQRFAVAAVRVQMHFSMNNHYFFSEAQALGFHFNPSWRHTGLLAVRLSLLILFSLPHCFQVEISFVLLQPY